MSRNLSRTDCYFCGDVPKLVEVPRPITAEEAGVYFAEYEGLLVANAECPRCGAKYLAWVDERGYVRPELWCGMLVAPRVPDDDIGFVDLSFRSTFNDEPGDADRPTRRPPEDAPFEVNNVSLAQARRELWVELREGVSTTCPCCEQTAKVYRRALHAEMARLLIKLFWLGGGALREWVHVQKLYTRGSSGDYAKLRFWGLVEPSDHRTQEQNAAGHWRVTERGVDFVLGRISVQSHVLVYNNQKVDDDHEARITITDALGDRFDYQALMASDARNAAGDGPYG
jgi:hypothetical protein